MEYYMYKVLSEVSILLTFIVCIYFTQFHNYINTTNAKKVSVILPGDFEDSAMNRLVSLHGNRLKTDIYMVRYQLFIRLGQTIATCIYLVDYTTSYS